MVKNYLLLRASVPHNQNHIFSKIGEAMPDYGVPRLKQDWKIKDFLNVIHPKVVHVILFLSYLQPFLDPVTSELTSWKRFLCINLTTYRM